MPHSSQLHRDEWDVNRQPPTPVGSIPRLSFPPNLATAALVLGTQCSFTAEHASAPRVPIGTPWGQTTPGGWQRSRSASEGPNARPCQRVRHPAMASMLTRSSTAIYTEVPTGKTTASSSTSSERSEQTGAGLGTPLHPAQVPRDASQENTLASSIAEKALRSARGKQN